MRVLIFCVLLASNITVLGQIWDEGVIEFDNGEHFEGRISLDENAGALYIQRDGTQEKVFPNRVSQFEFTDAKTAHAFRRRFISLPLDQGAAFFEILSENKDFSFLRKARLVVTQTFANNSNPSIALSRPLVPFTLAMASLTPANSGEVFTEEYFFIANDGKLALYLTILVKRMRFTKKEANSSVLSRVFGDHLQDMKDFAKVHHLKLDDPNDLLVVITEYNDLVN